MKATVTNIANVMAGGEQQTWRTDPIMVATVGDRLDFTLETSVANKQKDFWGGVVFK